MLQSLGEAGLNFMAESGDALSLSVGKTKSPPSSFQCYWPGSPWRYLKPAMLPRNQRLSVSRFETHCHFCLHSCLSIHSRLFLCCILYWVCIYVVLKKALFFSSKVTIFLHYLWAGPLQAIAVTALLWMEIGIACLAGIAVLIILLPLQSCFGKLFSTFR